MEVSTKTATIPKILSIHWGWLLGAAFVGRLLEKNLYWFGLPISLVVALWCVLQAGWLRKVDSRSWSLFAYLALIVTGLLSGVVAYLNGDEVAGGGLELLISLLFLGSVALFHVEMERYFNDRDDVGLRLSPWMTAFFSTVYFHYHLHAIARNKKRFPETSMPIAGSRG